jgi:hypothetical protein
METVSFLSLSPPPEGCSVELIYDSSTQPRGAVAQLPRTHFDTMAEAHIPPTHAERLINQFNRVSFPIMRDDRFVDILKDVISITPSEQVEARLKERLDTINSELDRQFKSVADSVLAQVLYKAMSDSQRSDTIDLTGLRSLYDAKSFVVHTLPSMVEALKKEESPEMSMDREGITGNIHTAKRAQPIFGTETAGDVSRERPPTPPSSESLPPSPPALGDLRKSRRIAKLQPLPIPMKTQGVRKRSSRGRKKK